MLCKKKLNVEDVTFDMVKNSVFGCINCLYQACECINRQKFIPDVYNNKPTCKAYCYFD